MFPQLSVASWQTRAPSLLNNSPGDGTWLWPWKAFGSVEIIVVLWPILGVENAISPLFKLFLFLPGYTLGDCILYPLSVSQTHLLGKVFIISKYTTILVEYHWGASVIGGASFPTNSCPYQASPPDCLVSINGMLFSTSHLWVPFPSVPCPSPCTVGHPGLLILGPQPLVYIYFTAPFVSSVSFHSWTVEGIFCTRCLPAAWVWR